MFTAFSITAAHSSAINVFRGLTVAVGSLHVVFHVALLCEADAAHLALKRLLSRVFDHVDLQSTLLVEGLVALDALKGPLACSEPQTTN